jgi:hypothetical protein
LKELEGQTVESILKHVMMYEKFCRHDEQRQQAEQKRATAKLKAEKLLKEEKQQAELLEHEFESLLRPKAPNKQ